MSLQIQDLAVTYSTARGVVQAVQDVSFEVKRGEITAIVGESGSGKSTTAAAIMGLLPENAQITAGQILLDDAAINTADYSGAHPVRGRRIGLIPQDPNNSLNPVKTIGASIAEGLAIHGIGTAESRKASVLKWLEKVGINEPERRYNQYPHELSGGMKQRCLIAAALALEPEYVIADEPTSALDVTVQKVILDLIDTMRQDLGIGVVLITHDLAVAGDRANHVVVMQHGQVRESGYATAVLIDPRDDYTKRLLNDAPSLNVPPARTREGEGVLLEVNQLRQEFGDFVAVDDLSFEVAKGTTHAIVGESGSGKTTTGRAIAGFQAATSGSIRIDGVEVKAGDRELRKRVQLVYQNPYSSLDPRQSIGSIIAEPLRNFGLAGRSQAASKVAEYLELVALDPGLAGRKPAELSGGQRQRVAIARALIIEPELVVLDEAVSALDVTVQSQILKLLSRLQEELGLTYVFISHDLAVVRQIADTVSVMSRGKQVEYGATAQVFQQPQSEFTRTLINAIPGQLYRDGSLNIGL